MISETMLQAINEQINRELFSAYLYRAAGSSLASDNYPGMADWMSSQASEENEHAEKFIQFVEDRGGRVVFEAIKKPKGDFSSPVAAFEGALEHEQFITDHINKLYALAVKEKDYAAQVLLGWFVDEQVEEEASVGLVVEKLRRAGNDSAALLMLDSELGKRSSSEE